MVFTWESDFLNTQYGKDLRLVVRIEPAVKYANTQTHQEIVDDYIYVGIHCCIHRVFNSIFANSLNASSNIFMMIKE